MMNELMKGTIPNAKIVPFAKEEPVIADSIWKKSLFATAVIPIDAMSRPGIGTKQPIL